MGPGTRRLLRLAVPSPVKAVERQLDPRTRLVLGANPDGSLAALLDDCADAAVEVLAPAPAWTRAEFAALRDRVAADLVPTTLDIVGRVEKVLAAAHEVQLALPAQPPPAQADAIEDIRAQFGRLLPRGFRHRHRRGASRRPRPLPDRDRPAPRPAAARVEADRERMLRVHAVAGRLRRTACGAVAGRARQPTMSATSPGRSRSCG